MPPLLSAAFMELTGFGTAVMTRYLRYQCIIACMFMDELDDVINSNRNCSNNLFARFCPKENSIVLL